MTIAATTSTEHRPLLPILLALSGAHLLNAFMWLMNEPVVEAGCFYDKLGSPVDINGVAIVKFASGALGSITIVGRSHPVSPAPRQGKPWANRRGKSRDPPLR